MFRILYLIPVLSCHCASKQGAFVSRQIVYLMALFISDCDTVLLS
ncbi:hypothetical protein THOB06_60105 [Vibrio rotiferianus]|nr:hypothetical protein THOG10_60105 [Vibrio rotiferianus]CAH1593379.1 hypothetical protein THOB06_60105 [Vibrio rotiferianus]